MGVEFHITRADFWAENEDAAISAETWLAYVQADPELELRPECGAHHAQWSGPSAHDEPWLDWHAGNIMTKWPDTALYCKMLKIAADLEATVQDDNGTVYRLPTDWHFDPHERTTVPAQRRPWWRLW
ncbi:hypothetical protein BLA50215_07248 [Burkholderia lata]|uniref:hypothetical protein n=1 Tax=Burkholderia lata (strain ATCC 17760 / DSM 23089 / LMG 22485 / NCIMB 9086 / R18194 / 383) TaxID=482957 RepID=UPI0014546BAA|nr:hypothetical protein [Burkholderia lata]VWD60209.1 hypothetical protein BLA50215_07248 [Burkholderia lata]